jgi:hypothetical protein
MCGILFWRSIESQNYPNLYAAESQASEGSIEQLSDRWRSLPEVIESQDYPNLHTALA